MVTDQRKRVHGCLNVNETVAKARISPGRIQQNAGVRYVVVALFSMFTLNNSQLPKNSVAVTNGEHEEFHGALYQHPAAAAWVQVNEDGVIALKGLFRENGQVLAEKIIAACKMGTRIKSFSNLEEFLEENCSCLRNEAESSCDFTT